MAELGLTDKKDTGVPSVEKAAAAAVHSLKHA